MLAFRLIPLFALVAGQSMTLISKEEGSGCDAGIPTRDNRSITWCIDDCMSNYVVNCFYIQWNEKTRTCYLGFRKPRITTGGDCITLNKTPHNGITDAFCMKEDKGLVHGGDQFEIQGMENEEECKGLCQFIHEYSGYIWNYRQRSCKLIFGYHLKRTRKLIEGEVQVIKQRESFEGGRCAVMKISAQSTGAKKTVANTLYGCLQLALKTSGVYLLDWENDRKQCWHHYRNILTNYRANLRITEMIKDTKCMKKVLSKVSTDRICTNKQENVRMKGGYTIEMPQRECLEICKKTKNCAAVDWDGNSLCIFHHFKKPLEHNHKGYTNYIITDCFAKPPTTASSLTETAISKMASPILNNHHGGVFYLRRRDKTRQIAYEEKVACLRCGVQCQIKLCTGFTCLLSGIGYECNIHDVNNPLYVPISNSSKRISPKP